MELRDQFALIVLQGFVRLPTHLFSNGVILADQLGVDVYKVVNALMRARDLPPKKAIRPGSRKSSKPKASKDIMSEIIALKNQGLTNKQIADKYKVNGQSINGLLAIARARGQITKKLPSA